MIVRGATRVYAEPGELDVRLSNLKLEASVVYEIVEAYAAAEASATPSEPKTAPGLKGWIAGIGALRDLVSIEFWESIDVRNWPAVRRRDGTIAVTVTTGDAFTGVESGQPSTKHPKGVVVQGAVTRNSQQLSLFSFDAVDAPKYRRLPKREKRVPLTWFLLIFCTPTEVRFELSLPSAIENKRIVEWAERLIFPPMPRQPAPDYEKPSAAADDTAPIDVPVSRK